LVFALLTIKPQLGILVPVLLLFERNWRANRPATCTVVLMSASIACFGLAGWQAYFTDTLVYQKLVMTNWFGMFLGMMPTTFGSLRTFGLSAATATHAQWLASLPAGVVAALLALSGQVAGAMPKCWLSA
jgi:hypothetical protein